MDIAKLLVTGGLFLGALWLLRELKVAAAMRDLDAELRAIAA